MKEARFGGFFCGGMMGNLSLFLTERVERGMTSSSKRRKPTKRLRIWYRGRREPVIDWLYTWFSEEGAEAHAAMYPKWRDQEMMRWWQRAKGVGGVLAAVFVCSACAIIESKGAWKGSFARSGAVLVFAAAYLELGVLHADQQLLLQRKLRHLEKTRLVDSSLDYRNPNSIRSVMLKTDSDNLWFLRTDINLQRKGRNVSRWALVLGAAGTGIWAYGDLVV